MTTHHDPIVDRQFRTFRRRERRGVVLSAALVGLVFGGPLVAAASGRIPQLFMGPTHEAPPVTFAWAEHAPEVRVAATGADGVDDVTEEGDVAARTEPTALDELLAWEPAPPPAPEPPPAPATRPEPVPTPVEEAPVPRPAVAEAEVKPQPEPAVEEVAQDEGVEALAERLASDKQAAEEPSQRAKGRAGRCGGEHDDIDEVEDNVFIVKRSLIEYYTADMDRFNSLGYSKMWKGDDGEKGWYIGGFGCRSPLFKAGLRHRDVIQRVNGKKTNNVLQLVGIWMTQRNKEVWVVEILRKGEPMTLTFAVI